MFDKLQMDIKEKSEFRDEIAKRMTFKEYAQAEAIARLWEGNSPREEAFKSVGLSKDRMQKLFRAQAASELECF